MQPEVLDFHGSSRLNTDSVARHGSNHWEGELSTAGEMIGIEITAGGMIEVTGGEHDHHDPLPQPRHAKPTSVGDGMERNEKNSSRPAVLLV